MKVQNLSNSDVTRIVNKINQLSQNDQQKVVKILTDQNNKELIVKAFAEKYHEVDVESVIRDLQKFPHNKKF
ncbi:MAG: hypothetical protein PV340_01200 [Wolbachia sp.]|nr:hypothetical protein [Wolbachia sp.]MDD9336389.1 hypothetical protein [Wolbachia sp.]